ncbi:MAG: OmpA family protein, partial [Desulfobulbaceae bacterium]|nr:OmpA family protein [Desulfobulbaceae bacterium]
QQTPDDIIKFTAGESKLGAAMKEQLNTLASLLKERPLLALNLTGFADGNADNRALLKSKKTQQAQPATNQATIPEKQLLSLAAKRAQTVQTLLIEQGVSPQQVRTSSPVLIAAGKTEPSGCRVVISLIAPP